MEKLSAESINRLIEDCRIADEVNGLKIPKTMTYPQDVFISFGKLVDNKERLENLLRQALPFFSANKEMDFPYNFFQQLGEKDENGKYKYWTKEKDNLSRYLFLGMYGGYIEAPKKTVIKLKTGEEREVLTNKIMRPLNPIVVKA